MSPTNEIFESHDHAARLIPWLVNGTLTGEDAVRLRTHLASCSLCAEDYESEKRLYEAVRAEGPLVLTGEPSFAKLAARLDADGFAKPEDHPIEDRPIEERSLEERPLADRTEDAVRARRFVRRAAKRRGARRTAWRHANPTRWLAAAVVLEAVCIGLVVWMWQARNVGYASAAAPDSTAMYHTLSTPPARIGGGPHARIVFRSDLTLARLQELLETAGAHIVDGPTEAHVYTLAFGQPLSTAALDARIASLRADPEVLFAEPADERPP